MSKAYHSTNGRSDHETPPALYWVLDQQRKYNLDTAASCETAKAETYYGLDNGLDGLSSSWAGRWWCNPPYGRQGVIRDWLAKGVREVETRKKSTGTYLIPARVGTAWYWEYVRAWTQWIVPGRLTYWVHGRPLDASAGFPSVAVHMGPQFKTGRVHFWDWRLDLEELSKKQRIPLPPDTPQTRYDHLEIQAGAWIQVEPWTRAEAKILLKPEADPDGYDRLIETRARVRQTWAA